eukprot:9199564-Alexandrium_andersonii.AAC.1
MPSHNFRSPTFPGSARPKVWRSRIALAAKFRQNPRGPSCIRSLQMSPPWNPRTCTHRDWHRSSQPAGVSRVRR